MRSAKVLTLVMLMAAPATWAQSPPAPAPAKPAAPKAAAAASPKPQPAAAANATTAPTKAKKSAKTAAKPAKKPVEQPATRASAGPEEFEPGKGARRDPFESLVARQQNQRNSEKLLPPGKAGLQVSTLRLDGVVKAPNGMIAVVTNPQQRTYFLREGDQLYDGRVEKIAMDGVSFHEVGKDAFGKPVEREVSKRIYSSTPGELQ